jgi:hypothetical protein
MAKAWIDPAQLTDQQLEAALTEIEGRLGDLRACDKVMELESRKWRLTAEQRYRQRQTRNTYFSHAGDVELELRGRFAKVLPTTVTGSEPVVRYPKQPEGSPWACDPTPTEPPLGIDVHAQEAVGEPHELATKAAGGASERSGDG